ncbi:pescadillo homolog [Andrographis paniculata]|uniref:pescadillo homolog n=1 Tax=Andrographis paniculata TaxID=175694 RepID=UPI0021E70738|nr:pescadillo homolog [Andrographis paniculata]
MPKHYRPAGKKKEGNAAKYLTRSQALRSLQVSLPVFRKLCIHKGVFPRVPRKKVRGNHHSYYHTKDLMFLKHEPLLETSREIRVYEKKVKKAKSKKNKDLVERLLTRKPAYKLDRLVKERYPKFVDALRDLDDCLNMVHLFAALPAMDNPESGEKIPVERVHCCRRLSHEWQAYISRTHKLRKTFISVKGIYYQAEVEGQTITWLTPHALQQVLPEVDYRILLTFLEFYETLLGFVNYRLYQSINVKYPPILDPRLEAMAADLYALSRYLNAGAQASSSNRKAITSPESMQTDQQQEEDELVELPPSEPGALMHLLEDAHNDDDEDVETRECKTLFKNMKFFLSREVPRESLLFIIPAFGGTVSWEGEGAPFDESDQRITHQIVDRPTQGHKFLSREYVQPQWVYDCVNARIILPTVKYIVGCVCPPHLSPFVDNEAEGHVPEYAEAIERLKAAARKEVLPLPGTGKEDLDDPQSLLGIADRVEDIEAEKRRQKMSKLEEHYQRELQLELQGSQNTPALVGGINAIDDEEDAGPDIKQQSLDAANMAKVVMPRRKRKLLEAMEIGIGKKQARTNRLKERKKKLDEAQKSK